MEASVCPVAPPTPPPPAETAAAAASSMASSCRCALSFPESGLERVSERGWPQSKSAGADGNIFERNGEDD